MTMIDTLHESAFAIRPVRIVGGCLREYDAITFPCNPRAGVSIYLRRCLAHLQDDGSHCLLDILDKQGDIVQDYPITHSGFEYLRRSLKFKWNRESAIQV